MGTSKDCTVRRDREFSHDSLNIKEKEWVSTPVGCTTERISIHVQN